MVVLVSGGLDSAVLLWVLKQDHEVRGLSFDYGQRHRIELESARQLCSEAKVPHDVLDLSTLKPFLVGSSQTDDQVAVPEGHYADPVMRLTVVPNRNLVMLSMAAAIAICWAPDQKRAVAFAAHAGDHPIYPDCRPEFITTARTLLELCHYDGGVELWAPFSAMLKQEVVAIGHRLGVPFQLTRSCYQSGLLHCGKCGTCVERREAFSLAGIPDPTTYENPLGKA